MFINKAFIHLNYQWRHSLQSAIPITKKKGTNGKRTSCSLLIGHMQIFKSIDFRTMGLWKWITFILIHTVLLNELPLQLKLWKKYQYGHFTIHEPPTWILREAYFPTFGSTRWQTLQESFAEWESTNWRNIWLTDWLFFVLKDQNDILQLHTRKPCSKVVIWGVKMTATLWQCTCGAPEIKNCWPISQNAAC